MAKHQHYYDVWISEMAVVIMTESHFIKHVYETTSTLNVYNALGFMLPLVKSLCITTYKKVFY